MIGNQSKGGNFPDGEVKYIAIVHGRNELVKCESCLNMKRSVTTCRERSQDRLVFDVYFRGGKEEMFDEFF